MLKWNNLTADATITIGRKHADGTVVILVNGSFGGGTLTLGYENQSGTFSPFASGTALMAAGEVNIAFGEGMVLMADLAGATTPTIEIGTTADSFTHED